MQSTEINQFSPALQKLLDKEMLKPGEVAIFKLTKAPTVLQLIDEKNRPHEMERMPRSVELRRIVNIIDPGNGQTIRLANVTGYVPSNILGQPMMPQIAPITFLGGDEGNGYLRVTADKQTMLARLLLGPENKDCINPSQRPPMKGYWFERVRPELTAKSDWDVFVKRMEAAAAVAEMQDDQELVQSLTSKLAMPLAENGRTLSHYELLMQLQKQTQMAPERIINVIDAGELKLEKIINAAVAAGIITANEQESEWRFVDTQQAITKFLAGYSALDALVGYIQKNPKGSDLSQQLVKLLDKQAEKQSA